jgi:uncharacterized membrane protein
MKKTVKKEIGEGLGISGFTLSVLALLFGTGGAIISIISFIFCYIQQKHKPTKLGKAGLIISIIAFILGIIWMIVNMYYLAPILKEIMSQANI